MQTLEKIKVQYFTNLNNVVARLYVAFFDENVRLLHSVCVFPFRFQIRFNTYFVHELLQATYKEQRKIVEYPRSIDLLTLQLSILAKFALR